MVVVNGCTTGFRSDYFVLQEVVSTSPRAQAWYCVGFIYCCLVTLPCKIIFPLSSTFSRPRSLTLSACRTSIRNACRSLPYDARDGRPSLRNASTCVAEIRMKVPIAFLGFRVARTEDARHVPGTHTYTKPVISDAPRPRFNMDHSGQKSNVRLESELIKRLLFPARVVAVSQRVQPRSSTTFSSLATPQWSPC